MLYKIIFSESAQKELKKIPTQFGLKIIRVIEKLSRTPRPVGCKKIVGTDSYRIRVNDYRVIYTIKDKELIIDIVKIGNRKEIYKRR